MKTDSNLVLGIKWVYGEVAKEMIEVEKRMRADPSDEHARGEHRAYFSIKLQLGALIGPLDDSRRTYIESMKGKACTEIGCNNTGSKVRIIEDVTRRFYWVCAQCWVT